MYMCFVGALPDLGFARLVLFRQTPPGFCPWTPLGNFRSTPPSPPPLCPPYLQTLAATTCYSARIRAFSHPHSGEQLHRHHRRVTVINAIFIRWRSNVYYSHFKTYRSLDIVVYRRLFPDGITATLDIFTNLYLDCMFCWFTSNKWFP